MNTDGLVDGQRQPPYCIAELGANLFPWSADRLARLIGAASEAGAAAVKAQFYEPEHFPLSERRDKAETTLALTQAWDFVEAGHAAGLDVGLSVFSAFLAREAAASGCDFLKLACREERNRPLMEAVLTLAGLLEMPVYRSVDMRKRHQLPFVSLIAPDIQIVHLGCVPEYPAPSDITALALQILDGLPEPYGWSSHTPTWADCIEAWARGATVVEKHLCLEKSDREGAWSLAPPEFKCMVEDLR